MKLYAHLKHANQSLVLPIVGEVKIDSQGSIEVSDHLVESFLSTVQASIPFSQDQREVNVKKVVDSKKIDPIELKVASIDPKQRFINLYNEVGLQQIYDWFADLAQESEKEGEPKDLGLDMTAASGQTIQEPKKKGRPAKALNAIEQKSQEAQQSLSDSEKKAVDKEVEDFVDVGLVTELIDQAEESELQEIIPMIPNIDIGAVSKLKGKDLKAFLKNAAIQAGEKQKK